MSKILSAPFSVVLSVTNKCNMRCKHCFASAGSKKNNEYDLNRWLKIIDKLSECGVFELTFSGGEPLVLPYIKQLLSYSTKKGFRCSLNTNASLISEEMAYFLNSLPMRGRISISFDGPEAKSYELLRNPNTFESVIKGIKYLTQYPSLNVRLFCVVTKYNYLLLEDIVEKAKNLDATSLEFNLFCPVGYGKQTVDELMLNRVEYELACEKILKLHEKYGDFVGGTFYKNSLLYKEYLRRTANNFAPDNGTISDCGAAKNSVVLYADGHVSPCEMLASVDCGNINDLDFLDIWRNSSILNEFRNLSNISVNSIEDCSNCVIKDKCSGGCRAVPYYDGNILGNNAHCLKNILEQNK